MSSTRATLHKLRSFTKFVLHRTAETTRKSESTIGHPKNTVQDGARWDGVHFPNVLTESKTIDWMEKDLKDLQILLQEETEKIISICGENGMGKTTLGRELFHSTKSIMHFERRAWVRVGPNYLVRDIIASILLQLESMDSDRKPNKWKEDIQAMEAIELMERIYKVQEQNKCLIVLDDVRTVQDFDTILFAFALKNGTGIVITTQLSEEEVPKGFPYQIHKMEPFTAQESWELLENQLEAADLETIHTREDIKEAVDKVVVKYCKGLPLAVKVFGGHVRGRLLNWFDMFHQSPEYKEDPKLIDTISISIKYLPLHLRLCLFYLAHFPDDKSIAVEKLYLMWIADKRTSPSTADQEDKTQMNIAEDTSSTIVDERDKTEMDIAEDNLLALVEKRLVMVHKVDYTRDKKIKSCGLHDLIRDRCMLLGCEEEFFSRKDPKIWDKQPIMPRITIQANKKHVQSILFSESADQSRDPQKSIGEVVVDLTEFHCAKVLDLDGVDFLTRKFPRGVDKLDSLTCVSIRECHLVNMPLSFKKLNKLTLLDLRVKAYCTLIIPSDMFCNMPSLLHLYFPLSFESSDEKLNLNSLTELEVLENFHAGKCNTDCLPVLTKLQIFKGVADSNNEDVTKMMAFIQGNTVLRSSSLSIRNFENYSNERGVIVKKLMKTCDSFHGLDIQGHLGELKDSVVSGDPNVSVGSVSNITSMVFDGSEFGVASMVILGGFQKLRTLVLCNDAFIAEKMEFTKGKFPGLACLKLSNLWSLNEFTVESGALPSLSSLTVDRCDRLPNLPDELVELPDLKEVNIRLMSKEFKTAFVNKTGQNAAKWRLVTFYNI